MVVYDYYVVVVCVFEKVVVDLVYFGGILFGKWCVGVNVGVDEQIVVVCKIVFELVEECDVIGWDVCCQQCDQYIEIGVVIGVGFDFVVEQCFVFVDLVEQVD